MVAVVRPADARCGVEPCARPLGAALHADRRGHRHGELRAFFEDEVVGSIPAELLTDECPRYEVEQACARRGARPTPRRRREPRRQRWIFEQYDQLVSSRTVRRPGLDAACSGCGLRGAGLAVALHGPRLGGRDPSRGRPRRGARRRAQRRVRGRRADRRSPTASTSATRRSPRSRASSREAIEGIARGCRGARDSGRVGQRVALQRHRRTLDPADAGGRLRRARARTCGSSRAAGKPGDVVLLAQAPRRASPPRSR